MRSCGMTVVLVAALLVLTAAGCSGSVGTTTSATSATPTSATSATSTSTSAATTLQATVTADEYDVYSALIESVYVGGTQPKQIVITPVRTDSPHGVGQAVGAMESHWPDLGDAVDDFKAKNRTSSVLERRFTISVPYTIVSEQEMASIFSSTVISDWKKFYAKYPDAKGFLALSRVGFNQEKDTAVLYTEDQRGPTAGRAIWCS